MERYGDDWAKIVAAYNAGSYNESKKVPGCPRNLQYIKNVKTYLEPMLREKLACGIDIGDKEFADTE